MAVYRTPDPVPDGTVRTTVAPNGNSSSSSAPTTNGRSRSFTRTSVGYVSTQWSRVDSLFSVLSLLENTSLSSQTRTITNSLRVEVLPPVSEREKPDWHVWAKCRGAFGHGQENLFYADHQHNGQVNEAKSVCYGTHPDHPGRCPVVEQCLEYALANGEKWGVWGGCSERERRAIKRARHREAALNAGNIIPIDQATPGDRCELASVTTNLQARDPAPWRYSKSLIGQRRQRRATQERCAASLGDLSLGMVSEG